MKELNLVAKNKQEELVKTYLQENASEILVKKINNGTLITKDGITLINKKTLSGFMKYACEEARKLAEKGATSACIEDNVVYGWAIHYFEESSVEEKLYNQDGTEYKPAPKKIESKPIQKPAPKKEPPKGNFQFSIFDLQTHIEKENLETEELDEEEETVEEDNDYSVDRETGEIILNKPQEKPNGTPLYQRYMHYVNATPNAVVIMRIGDFYEIFGEKAKTIANELNLTLTGRDCGLESRVPMIGFPYHAAEIYIQKIRNFYNVLLADGEETKFLPYENRNASNFDNYDEDKKTFTEGEEREFDENINEKLPVENVNPINEEDDNSELDYTNYIDREALVVLMDLLEDKLDIQ